MSFFTGDKDACLVSFVLFDDLSLLSLLSLEGLLPPVFFEGGDADRCLSSLVLSVSVLLRCCRGGGGGGGGGSGGGGEALRPPWGIAVLVTLLDLLRESPEDEEELEDERSRCFFCGGDLLGDLRRFFSLLLCLLFGVGDLCLRFLASDSDLCLLFLELFFFSLRDDELLSDLPLSFFFFFFFCLAGAGEGERELADSLTILYCFCCSCCFADAAAVTAARRFGSKELPST